MAIDSKASDGGEIPTSTKSLGVSLPDRIIFGYGCSTIRQVDEGLLSVCTKSNSNSLDFDPVRGLRPCALTMAR